MRIVYENIYFAIGIKVIVPDPRSTRYRQYVACDLRGRRSYGARGIKRDPGIICKKAVSVLD